MYVKLNFNAATPLSYCYRIIDGIINNTNITSIATLQSQATSVGWTSALLQNLDATNSEIIRTGSGITGLTSNTVSRFNKISASATYVDDHEWTVEFSRYDDTSKKYYISQVSGGEGTYTSTTRMANALTSGTLSSVTGMAQIGRAHV